MAIKRPRSRRVVALPFLAFAAAALVWLASRGRLPGGSALFAGQTHGKAIRRTAACPSGLEDWPLDLRHHERKVYSQTMQDGVLEEIFARLGTTNKYYVEFGFDASTYTEGVGANTQLLSERGWKGLLMDGGHENAAINLQKNMITIDNIVPLFKEYGVPTQPDYVSVDVDSCDIWLFLELTKVYR